MNFDRRLRELKAEHQRLIQAKNRKVEPGNGIFSRYENPVLTADHTPITWRYDLNPDTNPGLLERLGVGAVFNPGAIKIGDKYILVARVEGADRKSFFAIAESPNGIDSFRFRDYPVEIPELENPDTNVYDMRLTRHEDGWIYGLFCTERRDPKAAAGDTSSALAQAGIVRTRDLEKWERLPDLKTASQQQRNVVLHPEFVNGEYGFYTRPQDGFIDTGSGGGIGWGSCKSIGNPVLESEWVIDPKKYHTIKELKNGQGPPPLKTPEGWLHLAHGVRGTAAGLRYVLYMFMTDLKEPWKITYRPGGYFMAPEGNECTGDVSNVLFCSGWIMDDDGTVYMYYASSDTRCHVATSTIPVLLDYVKNTPEDGYRSAESVRTRTDLIKKNLDFLNRSEP